MKKAQLKKILKPIVKECIKESLLEGGILSKVIAEVVSGIRPSNTPQPIVQLEQQTSVRSKEQQKLLEEKWEQDRERRKKILNATGLDTEIFEGIDPITEVGVLNEASPRRGALAGTSPSDAGVDISGLASIGSKIWKKLR